MYLYAYMIICAEGVTKIDSLKLLIMIITTGRGLREPASTTTSAPLGLAMVLAQFHPPQPVFRASAPPWPVAPAHLLQNSCASDHVYSCLRWLPLPLSQPSCPWPLSQPS